MHEVYKIAQNTATLYAHQLNPLWKVVLSTVLIGLSPHPKIMFTIADHHAKMWSSENIQSHQSDFWILLHIYILYIYINVQNTSPYLSPFQYSNVFETFRNHQGQPFFQTCLVQRCSVWYFLFLKGLVGLDTLVAKLEKETQTGYQCPLVSLSINLWIWACLA